MNKHEDRMKKISVELNVLEKMEKRSSYEDSRVDALIEEFRILKAELETPVNFPGGLRTLENGNSAAGEVKRAYNIAEKEEFRSAIRSFSKASIENPQNLSMGRAIKALLTADWHNAEAEKRDMATSGTGGWVIGESLSAQIIPEILAASKVYQAGALSVPLTQHTTTIAKILQGPAIEIKAENAAFGSSTDVTFTGIQLIPVTIMGLIKMSKELAEDSINMEANIEKILKEKISSEVDKLALIGGTGVIGISGTQGILTEYSNGSVDYANFSNAYYKLAAANIDPITGLIIPSDMMKTLDQLVDGNQNYMLPSQSWSLYPKYISNQADIAVMGRFSDLIVGVRTELTIDVSSTAGDMYEKLQQGVRCYMRVAIAVRYPEAFCVISESAS